MNSFLTRCTLVCLAIRLMIGTTVVADEQPVKEQETRQPYSAIAARPLFGLSFRRGTGRWFDIGPHGKSPGLSEEPVDLEEGRTETTA